MIYDTKHKGLLDAGWKWDGEEYTRDFKHRDVDGAAEQLGLRPIKSGLKIEDSRREKWELSITVLDPNVGEYDWVNVCVYNNFYEAAKAVLGNK